MLWWEHQLSILLTLNNCNKQLPCMVQCNLIYDPFVKSKSQNWSTVENVKDAKSFDQPFWFSHCIEYPRTSTNLSLASPLFFSLDFRCLSFRLLTSTTIETVSQRSHKAFIYSQLFCDTLGYKRRLPYPVPYLPSPDSRCCLSCPTPCNEGDSKHILVFSLRNP